MLTYVPRSRIPYDYVAKFVREFPRLTGYGPALAEDQGIPLSSAHRWIYETRRRGFLPPGDAERPCPMCKGSGVRTWRGEGQPS